MKAFIEVLYVGQFADAMPSLFVLRDFFLVVCPLVEGVIETEGFEAVRRVHVYLVKKGNLYWPSLEGDLILLPGVILFLDARQQLSVKWQQGYCFENEVGKIVF